jgi:hypothetical protein
MNRSKIFLGLTTCALAVAGVAAAKTFATGKLRYYFTIGTTGTGGQCLSAPKTCVPTNVIPNAICTVLYGSQHHVIYTLPTCIHPLTYQTVQE